MPDCGIIIGQDGPCFKLNNGLNRIIAGKSAYIIHRLPHGHYEDFDQVSIVPLQHVSFLKPLNGLKLWKDVILKMCQVINEIFF